MKLICLEMLRKIRKKVDRFSRNAPDIRIGHYMNTSSHILVLSKREHILSHSKTPSSST
jgi:hypothetical protein